MFFQAAKLDEVSNLIFNEGYGSAEVLEMLQDVYYENLAAQWGAPDTMLSGFWGDGWIIDNGGKSKQIIVYYNEDGYALHVKILDEYEYTDDDYE